MFDSFLLRQAYQCMCKSMPGSYATMAGVLGISEASLMQRLGEYKGMAVTVRQAFEMQYASGREDFAAAVAQISGGVFVKLPDIELAEEDIQERFMALTEAVGQLVTEYHDATEDGELSLAEKRRMTAVKQRICTVSAEIIALTEKYYTVGKPLPQGD